MKTPDEKEGADRMDYEKAAMQRRIDNLMEQIKLLKRQRKALMEDFEEYRTRNIRQTSGVYACDLCKYGGDPYRDEVGKKCPQDCDGLTGWKWRGLCKQNGGKTND